MNKTKVRVCTPISYEDLKMTSIPRVGEEIEFISGEFVVDRVVHTPFSTRFDVHLYVSRRKHT